MMMPVVIQIDQQRFVACYAPTGIFLRRLLLLVALISCCKLSSSSSTYNTPPCWCFSPSISSERSSISPRNHDQPIRFHGQHYSLLNFINQKQANRQLVGWHVLRRQSNNHEVLLYFGKTSFLERREGVITPTIFSVSRQQRLCLSSIPKNKDAYDVAYSEMNQRREGKQKREHEIQTRTSSSRASSMLIPFEIACNHTKRDDSRNWISVDRQQYSDDDDVTVRNSPRDFNKEQQSWGGMLTVKYLESADILTVTRLCMQEYGKKTPLLSRITDGTGNDHGESNTSMNVLDLIHEYESGQLVTDIMNWFDNWLLAMAIYITMKMKVPHPSTTLPTDHAVIVAYATNPMNRNSDGTQQQQQQQQPQEMSIVGMVEVSRQPVIPTRNPSAIPIPLYLKQMICETMKYELEGWVSNLLIHPQHRGYGLSKILMLAAESYAYYQWQCKSIHLHCEANIPEGRIPQHLYKSLGYDIQPGGDQSYFDWSENGQNLGASNVYMIDDIPLLYLRKDLCDR